MRKVWILIVVALFGCDSEADEPTERGSSDAQFGDSQQDSGVADAPGDEDTSANVAVADSGRDVDSRDDVANDGGSSARLIFRDDFDVPRDFTSGAIDPWDTLHEDMADEFAVVDGVLEIVPAVVAQNHWFEASQGPYLHRSVDGDFVVEAHVDVAARDDATIPPVVGFNSAGFVIRDPASAPGTENWIMYNIGAQSDVVPFGVEAKTTQNSVSILELFDVAPDAYRLRVCRIGDALRYFHAPSNGGDWTEVLPAADHVREDLPATLQVGLVTGTWNAEEVRGSFDWIVAWRPVDETSCTEQVPSE